MWRPSFLRLLALGPQDIKPKTVRNSQILVVIMPVSVHPSRCPNLINPDFAGCVVRTYACHFPHQDHVCWKSIIRTTLRPARFFYRERRALPVGLVRTNPLAESMNTFHEEVQTVCEGISISLYLLLTQVLPYSSHSFYIFVSLIARHRLFAKR